jgi:hypothetical protein
MARRFVTPAIGYENEVNVEGGGGRHEQTHVFVTDRNSMPGRM